MAEVAAARRSLRKVWWLLLAGGGMVFAGGMLMAGSGGGGGSGTYPATVSPWVGWLPMGLLMVGVPLTYFVRNQRYKANWRGDRVTPTGYTSGNLPVLGVLEAGLVSGIVIGLLTTPSAPARMAAVVALTLLVLNFPHGRPMEPATPDLGVKVSGGSGRG